MEESLWVAISNNTKTEIRVGVIYAPQECRTVSEEYTKMYDSIGEQILLAKQKDQKLLLLGDFNCKVGEYIPENSTEVSRSGKNFLQLLKDNKLMLINGSDKCSGLWTRKENGSRSVLDYIAVNQEDAATIMEMVIDERKEYAPNRDEKSKEHVTSDHHTIVAKFNWMIDEEQPRQQKTVITTKGYSRIKEEMNSRKISKIWKKGGPFEDLYAEWKQEINTMVEKNSTKVRKHNKRKNIRELIKAKRNLRKESKEATKDERYKIVTKIKIIDEEIKKEDQKQYLGKIDKVVTRLKGKNGINIPNMWEVVKKIKGRKEEPQTAIKSKDGKMTIEDPEEIKDRYLEHFSDILQNKQAETEKEKKQEDLINVVFDKIMNIAQERETLFTTREEICSAIDELKKKKCKDKTGWNNEIVLEIGEDMIDSLLAMMNRMEMERLTPEQWSEMKVKAISKQGSALLMDNKRGLFITDILSKIYERVMKNRNNDKIMEYISDFQMGGVKMRSPADCLLLLSEVIRQKKKAGKKCYIVFGDAVKCFDKLWLKDSLVELYKAGCEPQDIQMIYNLNNNTIIEVETPCGTTKKFNVGEIVKQGTVLGPTLCCVSIDQINKIGESQERNIGKEYIAIIIFVDDVMSAGNPGEARKTIRNCREMEELKKVTYGLKKTQYMVMNTGKEKEEIIEEEVGLGQVTRTLEYKYMGFHVNEEANCRFHIEKKGNQISGQVAALKSIANFSKLGTKFLLVRLELYESCIVQSLLHGIEAWNKQTKKEIENLEKIQASALCKILEIPRTSPYIGILNETGIWKVEYRIDYRRIMLIQNILKSDQRRLSKRVVMDQIEADDDEDETIYQTTKQKMDYYNIDISKIAEMSKSELKNLVKSRIGEEMEKITKVAAEKMTKLRFIKDFKCTRKKYMEEMGGFESIQTLKTRLNMLPVYANYKGDLSMESTCMLCQKAEDNTEHLLECSALGETVLSRKDLQDDGNAQLWRLINEKTKYNLENRPKSSKWTKDGYNNCLTIRKEDEGNSTSEMK